MSRVKVPSVSEYTTRRVVRAGAERLGAVGVAHARHEAEWLLSRLAGLRPLDLYLKEGEIPVDTVARFFDQIEARATGRPLQYLLGETEFFGERFFVAPGVFIPRPETETIVEAALEALRTRHATLQRPLRLLDLGTGSGCIAVTLARALPACVVVGVELSWDALGAAKRNVLAHGVAGRVSLVRGHWVESIRGRWDGIVSNPPYVPSQQVEVLPLDVRQEPRLSLDGGEDGLRDLRYLVEEAPRLLAPGGLLVLECGETQVEPLMAAAHGRAWVVSARPLYDLAKRPRGLLIHG